jgi:hypothetical protein
LLHISLLCIIQHTTQTILSYPTTTTWIKLTEQQHSGSLTCIFFSDIFLAPRPRSFTLPFIRRQLVQLSPLQYLQFILPITFLHFRQAIGVSHRPGLTGALTHIHTHTHTHSFKFSLYTSLDNINTLAHSFFSFHACGHVALTVHTVGLFSSPCQCLMADMHTSTVVHLAGRGCPSRLVGVMRTMWLSVIVIHIPDLRVWNVQVTTDCLNKWLPINFLTCMYGWILGFIFDSLIHPAPAHVFSLGASFPHFLIWMYTYRHSFVFRPLVYSRYSFTFFWIFFFLILLSFSFVFALRF